MSGENNSEDHQKRMLDIQEMAHRTSVRSFRWTVFINLPLCIATLLLAVYTYNISISTRESTIATIEQNEITKENFAKQFRAYLSETHSVKATHLSNRSTVNDFDFQYNIKNSGQSPAADVSVDVEELIIPTGGGKGDISWTDETKCSPDTENKELFGLAAGQDIYYHVQKKEFLPNSGKPGDSTFATKAVDGFSPNFANIFESGNGVLIMTGSICYSDIFLKRHKTLFCNQFLNKKDFLDLIMTPCPNGNMAD